MRADAQALEFVDFDITEFADLLEPGDNVLAIHGLNLWQNDGDALIQARLVAEVTPIPEPSAIALTTIGLLALFGYGWRKRAR
jgi:hypothetical protein